jgi:hypothetical protein
MIYIVSNCNFLILIIILKINAILKYLRNLKEKEKISNSEKEINHTRDSNWIKISHKLNKKFLSFFAENLFKNSQKNLLSVKINNFKRLISKLSHKSVELLRNSLNYIFSNNFFFFCVRKNEHEHFFFVRKKKLTK